AQVEGMEVAGKTGTTNKSVDGWFCGYTPTIQALVWFGNDDNSPMQVGEYGGTVAGPAFKHFFTELLKSHPELKRTFTIPEGVIVSKKAGKTEYFTEVSQPPKLEDRNNKEEDENLLF
ncbi:MAG: penicillin-binding protein, partial [Thiovulaceae bacterium]|nr:penicillin-binding protein [Sulfurimonadaceae bacterium]